MEGKKERRCTRCHIPKPLEEFYRKNKRLESGYMGKCKECHNSDCKKRYYEPEARKRIAAYEAKRGLDPEYKKKKWLYSQRRLKKDIQFKLKLSLRSRLWHALKENARTGSAVGDLGCTVEEFKMYLEKRFQPGMTWENWGRNGWHIDHVRPISSFDLTVREQVQQACHYTNLQPLWAKENLSKSNFLPPSLSLQK